MCIAYLSLGDADWPVFIAANRDEFHARPTRPAAPWPDHPDVLAGIDLQGGGTWLGVNRHGRFALLTNYREGANGFKASAPSRGELVSAYLTGSLQAADHTAAVARQASCYNGFNLIVGDLQQASYISNRAPQVTPRALGPGRYVVSNHLLDTPWPKAERLRQAFAQLSLDTLPDSLQAIFRILKDTTPAADSDLPDTGISRPMERLLSSPFIISPNYGTRCSSIIAIHRGGRALFSEVSYDALGTATRRHDWPFQVSSVDPRGAARGELPA